MPLSEQSRDPSLSWARALLAVALSLSCQADSPRLERRGDADVAFVRVAEVSSAVDPRGPLFSGVTRAERRAELSFAIGGRLVERSAALGERVRAGRVLARIDDRPYRSAVDEARARLAELGEELEQRRRDLERVRKLADARAATAEELERATSAERALDAARDAAAARLREAERQLSEARLVAPFDGSVTEVRFEPGEYVGAGRPVVALSGAGPLEVEVEVPESLIARVEVGGTAWVRLPLLRTDTLRGRVASASRNAVGVGRLFPVVVTLPPEPGLVAGLTAQVVLDAPAVDALAVPIEALVRLGGHRPAVFRFADGRVGRVEVEIVELSEELLVVRGPLAPGDRVVVAGQSGLADGDPAKIEP